MSKKRKKRSPCPVACSLDLLGDKWTLIVIRDLYLGRSRFTELATAPESPPTNILTERLNRLLESKMVRQIPANDGTKHRAYELTEKGRALRPVLEALRDWGLKWIPNTQTLLGKVI
jgi:DNA-binding HxlR family transcriptional regulator